MKILLLSLLTIHAFAYAPSITFFVGDENIEIEMTEERLSLEGIAFTEDLVSELQLALFNGAICFKGKRTQVKKLLDMLSIHSAFDFGGEYSIVDVWYVGREEMKYEILDGPNNLIVQKNRISRCE